MRLNSVCFYLPLLVCLLILCGPYSSLAQEYIVDVQQFGIEEGLSSQEVIAVFRDKDGFLWISTENDLQRYDGYSMKSYPIKEIKNENIDFVIRNIGQDKKRMAVATRKS